MDDFVFQRVELQRVELETNIANFKKALRHWQTLVIDYEALKDEFQLLPTNASRSDCLKVAQDSGPELVDEKELQSLLGDKTGPSKSPAQLVDILSKRVDYVSRNIDTIKKQLSDAEKKRNALFLAEEPDFRDEAGLPLTEITEELDEDGRVVSSKVQSSNNSAPQLVDVLKKAGVTGIVEEDRKVTATQQQQAQPSSQQAVRSLPIRSEPATDSFGSGTTTDAPVNNGHRSEEAPISDNSQTQLRSEETQSPGSAAVEGDSEEDAVLRQEMLQYGLGEVGAIVAELDLEDDNIYYGDDDEDMIDIDSDLDEDDDMEESEDETGRTKRPSIPASYQRKMELLSKKHGISGMSNVGPSPQLPCDIQKQLDKPPPAEAARKAALARADAAAKSAEQESYAKGENHTPKVKAKKTVAFANDLDIALEKPKQKYDQGSITGANTVEPIVQTVFERSGNELTVDAVVPSSSSTKKVSRFKAARAEAPQTPMFAPPDIGFPQNEAKGHAHAPVGKIYEPAIIERPEKHENNASAPDADDIDETLHRKEIATEYHKLRNRMIHQQGGYVRDGEEGNFGDATAALPMEDEETGKVRKVSRFKAARMQ